MAADPSLSLASGLIASIIKQLRGLFDNQKVPGTVIFVLNFLKSFIDKLMKDDDPMKVNIMEAINFITGSGEETKTFQNSPFTYL